jgi:hypothetical protein
MLIIWMTLGVQRAANCRRAFGLRVLLPTHIAGGFCVKLVTFLPSLKTLKTRKVPRTGQDLVAEMRRGLEKKTEVIAFPGAPSPLEPRSGSVTPRRQRWATRKKAAKAELTVSSLLKLDVAVEMLGP